ncbi:YigZ family protein [Algoriphagus aestuariicola]|uniref:YigZ family protein n=1 Tax=Algoriphagus aestuariicola TaxID=1852016 RepID=A0ABS3BJ47_9BACT|nr:YigZ family protein [Algoriphagus aestuariicola]MBN7799307.1 YigZ family protein [Algoriphagus aestuariicola]
MSNFPENPDESDSYLTLAGKSAGVFKDQGSKFLYFAFPIKSEDDIKAHLADLRKNYFDATHHCFAWILGKDGQFFRANDDGEPNHSAGDPILGQIRSHRLTNVLIVIVRYFGGTKLGVSGLIKAYKTAASLAIEENVVVREWMKISVRLKFPYPAMNEVMKVVKGHELEVISQEMELDCRMVLSLREGLAEKVLGKLNEIDGIVINPD